MTDTSKMSRTFRDVCLVEDNPNGNGVKLTAFGSNGKPFATGQDFRKEGTFWDTYMDNLKDVVSAGKVIGDSTTLNNGQYGATYKDGGIKLDVAAGTCEVTTVDAGQIPNKPVNMGVVLKGASFDMVK